MSRSTWANSKTLHPTGSLRYRQPPTQFRRFRIRWIGVKPLRCTCCAALNHHYSTTSNTSEGDLHVL
jgi:hypothetical protein